MSSIEPGGVYPWSAGSARHRPLRAVAVLLLAAAAVAVYLEPWLVFDRLCRAARDGNLEAERELVDPALLDDELPGLLEACRDAGGARVRMRYAGFSRFVVTARPEVSPDGSPWPAGHELTLVLARRGLSWRLAEVGTRGPGIGPGETAPSER